MFINILQDILEESNSLHRRLNTIRLIWCFFLRDPLSPKVHEPDVNNVIHLCDIYNIPFATNLATAELLIKALDRGDLEWREVLKKEGTDIDE